MIDGLIIFFVVFLVIIERKRGFFRALIDVVAVVMATKLTRWSLSPASTFFERFFSEQSAGIVGAMVLFLFFGAVIFIVGNVIYRLTLLTIGDPFEDIFAIVFGLVAACGIVHLFLLIAMTFGSPATQEAIKNSLLGEPLYSFGFYFWLAEKLRPLTDPGKLYL